MGHICLKWVIIPKEKKKKQGVQGDGNPPVSPKEASAAALKRTALDLLPVMKRKEKKRKKKKGKKKKRWEEKENEEKEKKKRKGGCIFTLL